jgi:hypothetical protein
MHGAKQKLLMAQMQFIRTPAPFKQKLIQPGVIRTAAPFELNSTRSFERATEYFKCSFKCRRADTLVDAN